MNQAFETVQAFVGMNQPSLAQLVNERIKDRWVRHSMVVKQMGSKDDLHAWLLFEKMES